MAGPKSVLKAVYFTLSDAYYFLQLAVYLFDRATLPFDAVPAMVNHL
jgi:hypothetical protein